MFFQVQFSYYLLKYAASIGSAPLAEPVVAFPKEYSALLKGIVLDCFLLCFPGNTVCLLCPHILALHLFHAETYSGRSYYGGPDYICEHCGAVFLYQERVLSLSSYAQKRILYLLYTLETEASECSWERFVPLTGRHVACLAASSDRRWGGTPDAGPAFSGTALHLPRSPRLGPAMLPKKYSAPPLPPVGLSETR